METKITTNFGMLTFLKEQGLPSNVVENIELMFDVLDMRTIVETKDVARLKEVNGIGTIRANNIIKMLEGKIPAPMSKPVPDIKKPEVQMFTVPSLTLTYRDKACLTKDKIVNGHVVLDDNGKPVKNVNKKRFGPALRKLQQIADQEQNVVFYTRSPISDDYRTPHISYEQQLYWDQVVHSGINMGNGRKCYPAFMGTNDLMKNQIGWTYEEYIEKLNNWMICGADMSHKANIAKIEAYKGLLVPYTKTLLCDVLTPEMEVVIPEFVNTHNGKNVFFEPNGDMINKDTFNVSEFDGQVIIEFTRKLMDKLGLNRHQRRQLERELARFNGGTLRGPWHKGVIVVGFHIHDYLHSIGVDTIGGKDIDDIAMFSDKTVVKASFGENGMYKSWEQFCNSFRQLQHRFGVLLENHGMKHTFLPAQQLQAAEWADKSFVEDGAIEEVAYLNAAQEDPRIAAVRYAPRPIAKIAQEDPSIMSMWFANEMANNGYVKERDTALSGRTHNNSVTGFCIKDVVAFAQWIACKEGVRTEKPNGCLDAYNVYAPDWSEMDEDGNIVMYEGEAIASRNPVIASYGLVPVNVNPNLGQYEQFFDDGFGYMMVSIHDDLCPRLRMDHDGDKMRLTRAKWFIDAVRSMGKPEAFAQWESFGEVKKEVPTRANTLDFYSTATNSAMLGLNVDNASKLIANGYVNTLLEQMLVDALMNKGTDVKHGADGARLNGKAGAKLKRMQEAGKDAQYTIAQAAGKCLKGRVLDKKMVKDEYTDSSLDIISKAVHDNAVPILDFKGRFVISKLLCNHFQKIEGLAKNGKKNPETGKYEGAGVFDELVAMKAKEWNTIAEEDHDKDWSDFEQMKKEEALKRLYAFGAEHGKTEDDVYDALLTYVFITLGKTWESPSVKDKARTWLIVMARAFIDWFGDKMVENFCKNKGVEFLREVPEGVDVEEDIFG